MALHLENGWNEGWTQEGGLTRTVIASSYRDMPTWAKPKNQPHQRETTRVVASGLSSYDIRVAQIHIYERVPGTKPYN